MQVYSMDNPVFEADVSPDEPRTEVTAGKPSVSTHQADVVSRAIDAFWLTINGFVKRHKTLISMSSLVALGVLVLAYFIWAIVYYATKSCAEPAPCHLDWCHGHGFLVIMMTVLCAGLLYYHVIKRFFWRPLHDCFFKRISFALLKVWTTRFVPSAVYLALLFSLLTFLILDTSDNRKRLISFIGLLVLLFLGLVFSKHPGHIRWRPVFWGLALQFIFGLISIRWPTGRGIFQCVGDKVTTFLTYTDTGSTFVYGAQIIGDGVFAFKVLSVIFFFSFVVQILYYWGVMQWIVIKLGWLLQVSLGTTVCESVNAAASIFLGISEAPLLIKPYISDLTKSELHAVMTAGFATVAGTVLAAYINFQVQAAHLITASIMSAPAALCYSKLFYPETETSKTKVDNMKLEKGDETGVLDAATKGATAGIGLVLGIIANIIAFVAAVDFIDSITTWFAALVGYGNVNFTTILSKLFIPLVWLMGVEASECELVAKLVGLKTVVNEFVAYKELGLMKTNGMLSARAEAIATYALCGFSNPGSIGIVIGSLSTMAPERRPEIAQVAVRAFIAGSAVCFMTACIAGTLITEDMFLSSNATAPHLANT